MQCGLEVGDPDADVRWVTKAREEHGVAITRLRDWMPAVLTGPRREGLRDLTPRWPRCQQGDFSSETLALNSPEKRPAVPQFRPLGAALVRPADVCCRPMRHGGSLTMKTLLA